MFKFLAFVSTLKILMSALSRGWYSIFSCLISIVFIYNVLEILWLKWLLAVMIGVIIIHSIYRDFNIIIQKKPFPKIKFDPMARYPGPGVDVTSKKTIINLFHRNNKIFRLTPIVLLTLGILPLPTLYYIFSHLIVTAYGFYYAYNLYKRNLTYWGFYIFVVVLYNPIIDFFSFTNISYSGKIIFYFATIYLFIASQDYEDYI